MTRLSIPACVLGVVLATVAFPLAARGEGGEGEGALDRLTPKERRVLDERVAGFAELAPRRQEQIAANVIRLRSLEGEDRVRFFERVRAIERHREEHGRLPSGLDAARNPKRRDAIRRRGTLVRAAGHRCWALLSPTARTRIRSTLGRRGRSTVEMVFAQRLQASRARAMAAVPGPIEYPDDLPAKARRRAEQLLEQEAGGDPKARLRLAHFLIGLRSRALLEDVPATGKVDAPTLKRLGEAVEALDPALFEVKVKELERAAQSDRLLERYARAGSSKAAAAKEARLRRLLKALEDGRSATRDVPRLRGPAERLERALRQTLGTDERPGSAR